MNIADIQTFVAITELGGFTHAAQRLHRSQPAISRRLGILEHELGAPLFERLRGRARLTEAGRVFLPHAEAALASLRDGRDAVRGLQTGMEGVISLALVGTLADTRIVDALRQFAKRAKDVRLELQTASSREVTDLVRRGDATLGLRYYASDRLELVSLDAGSEAMVVVAAPGIVWLAVVSARRGCSLASDGSAFRRRPVSRTPARPWRANWSAPGLTAPTSP